jgi:hypothetical protein
VLADILLVVGAVAVWLFLSPCSPWTVWRGGSCALRAKDPPSDGSGA